MKHLISKEHHPHLKKRAIIELCGLMLLVVFSITQWEIIDDSLFAIGKSNIYYLGAAFGLYWLLLPLTAVSYSLLTKKNISVWTTTLAQAAGSGPGRIIPGGIGHVSVSIMHLRKLGVSTSKAIVASVANNLIGLSINTSVVLILLVIHRDISQHFRQSTTKESIVFLVTLVLILIVFVEWLVHARRTRRSILRVNREWKNQINLLLNEPGRFVRLVLVAVLIFCGNVSIFLLCTHALRTHISAVDAIIALSVGVFVGGLFPTPGGLGGVEAGTASTLVILGYDPAVATSISLLYRTVTYWQPLIPGTFAYLYLRERRLL